MHQDGAGGASDLLYAPSTPGVTKSSRSNAATSLAGHVTCHMGSNPGSRLSENKGFGVNPYFVSTVRKSREDPVDRAFLLFGERSSASSAAPKWIVTNCSSPPINKTPRVALQALRIYAAHPRPCKSHRIIRRISQDEPQLHCMGLCPHEHRRAS